MATSVMTIRPAEPVRDATRAIAELAGLSINTTTEALLCNALGLNHPHGPAIRRAVRTWRQP